MAQAHFKDNKASEKLLEGAKIVADLVKVTMGAKGRNVVIKKGFGRPIITHDGVTVAKSIDLSGYDADSQARAAGADLIQEAAEKMNAEAGDGTTTVSILTYEILRESNLLVAAGHNPMVVQEQIEAAGADVIKKLSKMGESIVGNKEKIIEVATISAANRSMGEVVGNVIDQVGADGVVTVETGEGLEIKPEIIEGFSFDRGFISGTMVTDQNRLEARLEAPSIIITSKRLTNALEVVSLFKHIAQAGIKNVLLIAENVEADALNFIDRNRQRGIFNVVAVKAPAFGERRKQILEDIAILTGATVIGDDTEATLETADVSILGKARRVIVGKENTTIIEGAGDKKAVEARIKSLTEQKTAKVSDYEKEQIKKRAAALSGKVAVIKIGGASETEIEQKKFRIDDAVAAARAAISEGIVPGGGVTLVNLSDSIKDNGEPGRQIVKRALLQPFRQLMINAGYNADALLKDVQRAPKGMGINVMNGEELIDMKENGVIDPVLVTKLAIQNAISVAGTGMTSGALIVDIPERRAPESYEDALIDMGLDS